MKQPLKSLIGLHSRSELFDHYERATPFVVHGLGDSIGELTRLPFLESLDALLASWPKTIDAYLPGIADEANSMAIAAGEGLERFKKGSTLLFNDVNTLSPLLSEWLFSLQNELGLSELTEARNLVYATPAGTGTDPHFDQNINFVLAIHGSKKWWVAPNHHVDRPMSRHAIGIPTDPELASYANGPMPIRFPDGAEEFLLSPGSLLFVPRGAWHRTEALTDALSLNFTFSAPTWIDIVTATLRRRLAQSPEWRETANFGTDTERIQDARKKLDRLLFGLAGDVADWSAADILEATEIAGRQESAES